MALLSAFLEQRFAIFLFWLLLALFSGLVFAGALVSVPFADTILPPLQARSLHISLMLYGFVPLLLSFLPFALFEKDNTLTPDALKYLNIYFLLWNLFLIAMSVSTVLGNLRGLPFYDFPYELNFILVAAGMFYFAAILSSVKQYKKMPVWVKVSFAVVIIAPILLVVLMNPTYGQVEKTLIGPHGDNTLGMSLALIPLFYLLIKLYAKNTFVPRYHIFWIIPLVGYLSSLVIRNFFQTLSYEQEWFFQYLTLLYLPLLLLWKKDAELTLKKAPFLLLSIWTFILVDIEGNVLFIPAIRTLMHRNDLVIAHAHLAMGISVAFMSMSIAQYVLPKLIKAKDAYRWFVLMVGIALVLSIAGLIEGKVVDGNVTFWLFLRFVLGLAFIVAIVLITRRFILKETYTSEQLYHSVGFLSDFGGGVALVLFYPFIFSFLGIEEHSSYLYVIFVFMMGTGILHWKALASSNKGFGSLSATIRMMISGVFLALTLAGMIHPLLGWMIVGFDASMALIYWTLFEEHKWHY